MANAATLKMCVELASFGRNLEDADASGQSCPCTEGHPGVVRPRPYRAHASVEPRTWKGFHFGGRPTMTQRKWVQVGASQLSPGKCARLRFNRVQLEGICLAGHNLLTSSSGYMVERSLPMR